MTTQRKTRPASALAAHRARIASAGAVRVEVTVGREDAGLIRQLAAALSDPARHAASRTLLQTLFPPAGPSLKDLLTSAPLDGITLDRDPSPVRTIDL